MEATRLPGGRVSIRVSGLKLEGTPRDAMRVLGYSKQRIYELIEAGEIEARPRTPGRAAKAKPDKLGRRRSFSLVVDMVSVYRLKYGERKAAEIAAALSGGRN